MSGIHIMVITIASFYLFVSQTFLSAVPVWAGENSIVIVRNLQDDVETRNMVRVVQCRRRLPGVFTMVPSVVRCQDIDAFRQNVPRIKINIGSNTKGRRGNIQD